MSRVQDSQFRSALEAAVASFELAPLTEDQTSRLVGHYTMLVRWNQRINLTRIVEPLDAAKFHYAESLFGARFITEDNVLDIGSGAGFPAIPIALTRPDVSVTALEPNQKKSLFLKEAKDELELGNLNVVSARLEDFDWTRYELLTSRALERAEEIFPLVIASLSAQQRLMLFCTSELISKLEEKLGEKCTVEIHPIPQSSQRVIAILNKTEDRGFD